MTVFQRVIKTVKRFELLKARYNNGFENFAKAPIKNKIVKTQIRTA